jgi:hypothetical protein
LDFRVTETAARARDGQQHPTPQSNLQHRCTQESVPSQPSLEVDSAQTLKINQAFPLILFSSEILSGSLQYRGVNRSLK